MQPGPSRPRFPQDSLLAALLGEAAPRDLRRAAQRLRAEGGHAVAVEEEIAGLAQGLAQSEVSRSPAVAEALPPIFWMEMREEDAAGQERRQGWLVERRPNGFSARQFRIAGGAEAVPEALDSALLTFGAAPAAEDAETRRLRGLVTALGLPELLAQMGESSPILLLPAEAPGAAAGLLRGLRLSIATTPEAAPG
ncbi:hypothetical protein [Pseudoroseomonas cervicalis]|uniref:hypothetical protein n=1 Tax=Teichococcus cervicalis TaxID=204525 RepID=UPI002784257D|nr:hypothetical protein [Pseudoroseomonas cervicalis]MDQ1081684.1 hypothetical protein [Pseudoroseomonas cervicalis]